VVDKGRFAPTEEGTPQGGVVSPLLLNVALHGMEQAAGVRYHEAGGAAGRTIKGCPVVARDAVTRKAVRKQAVTAERGPGTPDGTVAFRLIHARCRPRTLGLTWGVTTARSACGPAVKGSPL